MPSFRQKIVPQSDSTNLKDVAARQIDFLEPRAAADRVVVDISTVRRQSSLQAAIGLCIAASGRDRKQIYGALDIDAATFSRIESGQAHFPPNKLVALMHLCGNEAPLIWLCESSGYDFTSMRKHRSNQEKRVAELEQENHDLKRLLRLKADIEAR
jgi:hypothetical protein